MKYVAACVLFGGSTAGSPTCAAIVTGDGHVQLLSAQSFRGTVSAAAFTRWFNICGTLSDRLVVGCSGQNFSQDGRSFLLTCLFSDGLTQQSIIHMKADRELTL